ncbi:phage adsorption protein NrfB [Escherichia coli]|uniref:cyclic di-3',5'-guanylate-activated glycosyltransferase NfrB n=1 Tax=Escherichia coli TaxID=562 RepID=UPI00102D7149|nr:cyclic di-3',5'-guanylate-activated glycosyltransferase NrfB [Escherichia coli]EGO4551703.1 phage adsorption protein NrfB [Escherichia coli]EHA0987165.1 phage adsorption protein NrfB [Escherichia coli]MEB6766079.1 phage adsorption protein NrfB [Escherichia coli]RZY01905.1 phage adsorption protein NrfB [Escherichia coli]BEA65405.1 bacteriophage adsorption protein B [Escherichia coli]
MSTGLRFTLEVDGLPPDAFAVVSFHLNQSLSSLFSLDLSLVSQQFLSLEFAQVLDKMAYLTIWQGDEVQRRVKGVVTWFELGENDKNQMLYSMKVHPPLWRAGLRQNFRIFQNEDIKSILGTMLQENGVTEWSPLFSEPHPSREFCVQYGETDYDFLCRMAAEEGIFFYEEHAYKSTDQSLVLCDTVRHLPESFEIPWNPNTRTEVSTLCISQFRYWVRRIKRKLSVYRRYPRMSYRELYKPDEKPLAIMVPAWNETGVIGNMAELAATTLDYENYHIFVGTYPNDPDTQRDVDEVCARFPNVHKVVCARPGPTSKADCLNNVLDAITQFERSANFAFAGFILHDAEDVISPMELRLFNYLVERKDLIQIPVYPFEREWTHFTSMTYIDEFSELHGKDVPVREALAGQVPSAGVGTCFSRRAVTALLADGDGIAFDVQSLTEDYDIGFRLKEKGMTEIFVRFPVVDEAKEREQRKFLQHARTSNMICVREYFPDTFSTAVRQKSRWIIGIVFQGFKTHKWTSSLTLNYFLWRDRKGAISNFVSFLAMLVMLQLLLLLAYESLWPDAWHFLSIFSGSAWLMTLLWLNFGLMVNRIVQRVIFVTGYYGLTQGLLSVLRLFWGNLINFMANWRALKQVLQHGDPRRVAWDKTTHDFPSVTGDTRSLRPLGQILLENQVITEEQLDTALRNRVEGLRLGGSMLMQGLISAEQLAQALAEQNGVAWESIDAWQIPSSLIAEMPASVALHYAVLPLRLENDELIVGSEDGIDPVSLAALTRKVGRKVRYVIVLRGQIVTGLRHWYARRRGHDPRAMLYNAVQHQWLTEQQTGEIWRQYVPHQFLFAEILTTLGHINRSAINVLLLRHERSSLPLGKFLVTEGVISQETLDRVLTIQRELQVSMQSLLLKAGLNTEQVAQLESENEGE